MHSNVMYLHALARTSNPVNLFVASRLVLRVHIFDTCALNRKKQIDASNIEIDHGQMYAHRCRIFLKRDKSTWNKNSRITLHCISTHRAHKHYQRNTHTLEPLTSSRIHTLM